MRKTILALASAFILLSLACNKDKNDTPSGNIQGKWFAQKAVVKSYVSGSLVEDTTIVFSSNENLEFKSDGTLVSTDEDGDTETYTYTYDTNTKTLSTSDEDDGISSATVTKLTSSELTLHGEENDTFAGIVYKAITDLYLKK